MKRVLIFSTAYIPFIGGAEVAVKEITDRIPDMEFVMITARLDQKLPIVEKIGNIEVHRLGRGNQWDKYRLIWQGPHYAQKLGLFDAIWGIMASYAGFAALRFKKANKDIPFLLTLQEGDSRFQIYKHVWWCWPYFKQIFKRADKIQAISNYLAVWAKDLGAKCEIEVVPNGVDINNFQDTRNKIQINSNLQTPNIKKDLHIEADSKIIVTVSRLVRKNGVEDLIGAIQFLPNNYHLLIVGSGELENELKKQSNERVHFLGTVSHDDLPKYLYTSDVFCRPSLSEGLGNVFLEAMAVGIPVVGTKVGGIPDFLEDGKTGWFCEVKNPKSIAEKIQYILDDKNTDTVQQVVKNAKKMVHEKYSWDLIGQEMRNIFEII